MYNSSEEDLFPGHVKPFDPLKAQIRRAEIYKRALELFVANHNRWAIPTYGPEAGCDQYEIDEYIDMAKFEVDNAAQS